MSEPRGLRVVMATARFWPELGGIETHVLELGTRLVAAGVSVTVATTDRSHALPAREVVQGISVRRFPAYPRSLDLYFSPRLARFVAHARADLVHVQGFHTLVAPLAMLAAGSAGRPYVVTLHTGGHSSPLRTAIRPIQAWVLRPLMRRAEAVVCVSDWEATTMAPQLGLDPRRTTVIPSGVSVPIAGPTTVEPGLIVSPGRLERYKGHDQVIDALPLILRDEPRARLRLLGDGPAEHELRARADRLGVGGRVEIGPVRGRPEMAALVSRASVVVSLSDYESQGLAVHEALGLGRPVVVTAATALEELVRAGVARGISPGAAPSEIAAAIIAAMEGPPDAPFAVPTWDECTEAVIRLYGVATAGRR